VNRVHSPWTVARGPVHGGLEGSGGGRAADSGCDFSPRLRGE
jgi:hypothetical protein